ncbi:MAG: hypothetical protein IJH13_03620 [Bacilli bacterium]|nr:hypothetical protein [Bacilli bacterium]
MDNKDQRIAEIDERIHDLREHGSMWAKAGGVGGRMAAQAYGEIKDLEMEKDDLINGTNNLGIKRKEEEIRQLKALRKEANFLKRMKYNKQITQQEAELEAMINTNPGPSESIEAKTK